MPLVPFESIPDDGRLWAFGAHRPLDPDEEETLLEEVDRFLDGWEAHGHPLAAAREWRHGRFLLVAVDERTAPPSGCSIDAMVRRLRELEERLGVGLVDHGAVWYRGEDGPERVGRGEFRRLVEDGAVDPETVVWDQTVTRVRELREGEWERPADRGWHRRAFFRQRAG